MVALFPVAGHDGFDKAGQAEPGEVAAGDGASEADGPEAQTQSKEVGAKAVSGAWSTGGGPAVTTG